MDILFENRYIVDLHMLRSFARGASFSQKFFFRFSIVGMAVCTMALLYCLVFFPGRKLARSAAHEPKRFGHYPAG